MGINFREVGQRKVSLARVMENRDNMDLETLMEKHPNKVTIIDFDSYVDSETGEYIYAFVTKEEPNHFTFAGKILKDCFTEFESAYEDNKACVEELKAQGGVAVELSRKKSKDGKKEYTAVKFL